MSRTVIKTNVPANSRSNNILANTKFQFADQPGDNGAVQVQSAFTSAVAGNSAELTVDKDFQASEIIPTSADPAKLNENPGIILLVEAGSQINIDLINDNGAAQNFVSTIEFTPV